jgi:integrase
MARQTGIWFWKSRKCYYTWFNGKQHRLDPNKNKAARIWAELVGKDEVPGHKMLVKNLLNAYLDWSELNHAKGTHKRIRPSLLSFGESLPPGLRVNKLLPRHLTEWIDQRCPKQPKDGSKPVCANTRRGYLGDVMGAFTWAASAEQKIIPYSPFGGYRRPPKTPRAACLTGEQWDQLLAKINEADSFRDFLVVLRETGCRPQEARIVAARHIDFKRKMAHFKAGEIPGKPWERDIILNDAALAVLQRCALKYPEGPLLRNTRGRPWGKNGLNSRFQRLNKELPFRAHCYVARHSRATELLENGASAGAVAAILGHRDPTMVLRVYGKHIEDRDKHLRDCIEKADENRKKQA